MVKKINNTMKKILAGGVNSPVRAFKHIGCKPLIIKKANGSKIYTVDGRKFIDFCLSWGAIILGHSNPYVNNEIKKNIKNGTNFGLTGDLEIKLGKLIKEAFPSIDLMRFVNSGTEATMTAIRLARAFTKRNIVLKFDGCYHGHSDSLLVSAGSGVANIYNASSSGVPTDIIKNTISIPFNNLEILKNIIKQNYKKIACVIMEPIPANMGLILPYENFLYETRKLTKKYGILLIFDEIITGFRVCYGGVQNIFNIKPDLTCLGKIIGGGLPIGAVGGKKEIMKLLAPEGNVYQAGTFSGNPVVMSAGIAVLNKLKNKNIYKDLKQKIDFIKKEVKDLKNIYFTSFQSMFSIYFSKNIIRNFEDVKKCDFTKFKQFYLKMLNDGIFLPPSQLETSFISVMHSDKDIEKFSISLRKNLK